MHSALDGLDFSDSRLAAAEQVTDPSRGFENASWSLTPQRASQNNQPAKRFLADDMLPESDPRQRLNSNRPASHFLDKHMAPEFVARFADT